MLKQGALRVLLVGYRSGLRAALETLGIPYAIWSDVPIRRPLPGVGVIVRRFGATRATCRRVIPQLASFGPFTHVIAGTEASVVCASHMRHLLDCRRSPHTLAHRCHDKLYMKQALARHGVPMTPFINGYTPHSAQEILHTLGRPVVVKDRTSSGGRGIEIVHQLQDDTELRWPGRILEAFVDADEISVESYVSGGEVLFSNITRYQTKRLVNVLPADLEAGLRDAVLALNRQVIGALRIAWGITHMEVFTASDGPLIGEIALRPPGGYIMDAMALAYDFNPWLAMLSVELDLPFDWPMQATSAAAAMLIHPGPGTITAIDGVAALRADPCVNSIRLRLKPGQRVPVREGLADIGRVLLKAQDHAALASAIERVGKTLNVVLEQ